MADTTLPQRIVVVGPGAIGGLVAAQLHLAGNRVEVVARGAHLEAIRTSGLTRRAADGEVVVDVVAHATVTEAAVTPDDLVLLATKTPQAEAVLDEAFAAAGPEVPVACLTNGVEAERLALRRFEHVIGVLVNTPGTHLDPGVVEAHSRGPRRGLLDVGRYPRGAGRLEHDLAATLTAAEFTSEACEDVMARKWAKLLGNVGNVGQVLAGLDRETWWPLYERLRAEAEAVTAAAGIVPDLEVQQHRATLVDRSEIDGMARAGGSTWQSAVRGTGSLETVALNGEITLRGRLHGVPTPANASVHLAAERLLRDGGEPGTVDVEALLASLPDGPGAPGWDGGTAAEVRGGGA